MQNAIDMLEQAIKAAREQTNVKSDLVEVVRCKDCKWWEKQENSLQGRCILSTSYPTENWYCANGKRKENEQ